MSLNGKPITNWNAYRSLCAYVEQDDILFHTLTVYETLELAAQLRLPKALTYKQKMERVDAVLSELNLRKCAHTPVGNANFRGVSGGERKRVAIAIEVLRNPQVLFLDECTSGLDSFQALRVIETIKDLAKKGRTVVTSIHQPRSSIYALFDDLIVVSEGHLMYLGPAKDAVAYFSALGFEMPKNYNPADFVLDLVSIDVRNPALEAESRARHARIGNAMREQMQSALDAEVIQIESNVADMLESRNTGYEASYLKQFLLLAKRAARQKLRDPSQIITPFFIAVFFGLVMGFVYFQNGKNMSQEAIQDKAGLIFFISLSQSFNGIIGVVSTFPIEKEIANRERAANSYAVGPYYFSKILIDLPMLLSPALFNVIIYWIAGLPPNATDFFEGLFLILAVYLCANGFGLIGSAIMSTPDAAQAFVMPFVCEFLSKQMR